MDSTSKVCRDCGHEKLLSQFRRRTARSGYTDPCCRECSSAASRAYAKGYRRREHRHDADIVSRRFLAKVDKGGGGGCWLWTGAKDGGGYGSVWFRDRSEKAHRVSYCLAHDVEIPTGTNVCHTCDTPACVNPDHLFLGTQKDNMADSKAKGRHRILPPEKLPRGERQGCHKLRNEQVLDIRRLYSEGSTLPDLAGRYGVSRSNVYLIVRRRTWKHV